MNIKNVKKWHLFLLWPSLLAMSIYVISAFTHPLMAWTGPQAKVMFPPSLQANYDDLNAIESIIKSQKLTQAKVAKLVPSDQGNVLQITQDEKNARRYFSLKTGLELNDQDRQQAIWLARHYTGNKSDIRSVEFKQDFDGEYSWVNRLLPVYKVNFNTPDNLSVFIHTETLAMASISNDWKRSLSFIFRNFHSLDWLNDYEALRLIIISLLMVCIAMMLITGFLFLIKINRKKAVADGYRRWHRYLAWAALVPLTFFTLSGFYHLLQSSMATPVFGMKLTQDIPLNNWMGNKFETNLALQNHQLNQISLLTHPITQAPLYRLSVAADTNNENTRKKRFDGAAYEKSAIYLDAKTKAPMGNLDIEFAKHQARQLLGLSAKQTLNSKLITHFGMGYDFRNKRLPVWQLESEKQDTALTQVDRVYIDPVTHILVDKSNGLTRLEGYSFSFLHKWNMLNPLMGRFNRDLLIMTALGIMMSLTMAGLLVHLKRRQKAATMKQPAEPAPITERAA